MKIYISSEEIMELTGLNKRSAMKIINSVREEMKKKGYFIPEEKKKYALRGMVEKLIGVKKDENKME